MLTCFYRDYGSPNVLEFGEVPEPKAEAGQVVVKMAAASVTPFDCKLRAGKLKDYFSPLFPNTPGRDGTGTVVALVLMSASSKSETGSASWPLAPRRPAPAPIFWPAMQASSCRCPRN